MSKTAFATDNLEERLQVTESFVKDSGSSVDKQARTIFHPAGTCRMGPTPAAAVDLHLRVNGISGLRVADCSVMPALVSGNTNAPTMMIADRAADAILADL